MSRFKPIEIRSEGLLLVVLEPGSGWPAGIEPGPAAQSADAVVLAPQRGDSPRAWLRRALDRVAALEARGHCLDRAVIAAGHDGDEARVARAELAHALLSRLTEAGGLLEVVAAADLADSARHALMSLLGDLVGRLSNNAGSVRLRFEPQSHEATRVPARGARAHESRVWQSWQDQITIGS